MLVAEQAALAGSRRPAQILASEVDRRALDVARVGIYPESIAHDVSAPRLKRFFTRLDAGYKVAPAIREPIVFAAQNASAIHRSRESIS